MDKYVFQKSKTVKDGYVLTDTENGIVVTFAKGRFNETQKFTLLEDVKNPDPNILARAVREMTDWLIINHRDVLI